jgi:hypothetical protein
MRSSWVAILINSSWISWSLFSSSLTKCSDYNDSNIDSSESTLGLLFEYTLKPPDSEQVCASGLFASTRKNRELSAINIPAEESWPSRICTRVGGFCRFSCCNAGIYFTQWTDNFYCYSSLWQTYEIIENSQYINSDHCFVIRKQEQGFCLYWFYEVYKDLTSISIFRIGDYFKKIWLNVKPYWFYSILGIYSVTP